MNILFLAPIAKKNINKVIEWLIFYKKSYSRVNNINKLLSSPPRDYTLWTRKMDFSVSIKIKDNEIINNYLNLELKIIVENLIFELEKKRHLGNYFLQNPNKLNHLSLAKDSGLLVPDTLITSLKKDVIAFKKKHSSIITKSIKDCFKAQLEDFYYYNHTERAEDELINQLNETFFPSLFQQELDKEFDLRIIFLEKKIWSMAIFSQNDRKTEVDWRNYNDQKPNRKIPFSLPTEIKNQIESFISLSGLNIGAIDMVFTKCKKFYFLECNPNGQYDMVSDSCNFYIEKYVADYLIKN